MSRKYHSNLAFNDLLFNIMLGFVVLFFIAFLLINPPTKADEVPLKAEWMIIVQWPGEKADDVDIWIKSPNGDLVGYRNKETALLHLDRDDLGIVSDTIIVAGKATINAINREVVTIRGIVPGDYYISLHMYSKSGDEPLPVTVSVIDVNPYNEVYNITVMMDTRGQQSVLPGFVIDSEGNLESTFETTKSVVPVPRSTATQW
jgi:hypothetical protein